HLISRSWPAARTYPQFRLALYAADTSGIGNRGLIFCSSTRSEYTPESPLAPGRSNATMNDCVSVETGVQRTCTLRNHASPVGPQYSRLLGNESGSVNGLQYCPAPNCPTSPQAWRNRI